ncbi:MAG: portal protein, partial [Parcubacteria group bacterium]|nr:portal protein [Parcubacteria group bacterium]
MAELFGFTIKRAGSDNAKSFVAPSSDDGSLDIGAAAGFFGQYYGAEATPKNDFDLVKKYRAAAEHPEADQAIEDIVNEAIISNEGQPSVSVSLDYVDFSVSIKKKIQTEFDHILKMLHWNNKSHELFKRWYIDGRIYFHKLVDEKDTSKGVLELRYIDPRNIKKVREIEKGSAGNTQAADLVKAVREYFLYSEDGIYPGISGRSNTGQGLPISSDSISYITSGLYEPTTNQVYSHLHKAIKPVNQLRMMEDALVIYRISRAPERRIFYIDVG